jgi:hypothetical protein
LLDSYYYSHATIAQISETERHLTQYPFSDPTNLQAQINSVSTRTGLTTILISLRSITGLSYETLAFIPIGGLLLTIAVYVLTRRLTSSNKFAFCAALFIAFEPYLNYLAYNTNTHAWGFFLFLIFVFLVYSNAISPSFEKVGMIILIFIVTAFVYYTIEFYIILFMILFAGGVFLYGIVFKDEKKKRINRYIWIIPLLFLILFIIFDPIFSGFLGNQARHIMEIFFYNIGRIPHILFHQSQPFPNALPIDPLVIYFNLFVYLLIGIPTLILVFDYTRKFMKLFFRRIRNDIGRIFHKRERQSKDARQVKSPKEKFVPIICISLFLIGISDVLIYLIFSQVSFKMVLLLYPITAVIFISHKVRSPSRKFWKGLGIISVIVILMAAIVKIPLNYNNNVPSFENRHYESSQQGIGWINEYIPTDGDILLNLDLAQLVQLRNLDAQNQIKPHSYFALIGGNNNFYFLYSTDPQQGEQAFIKGNYDYLVLSKVDLEKFVLPGYGTTFKPIGYPVIVDSAQRFNLIYSDNYILIYSFK